MRGCWDNRLMRKDLWRHRIKAPSNQNRKNSRKMNRHLSCEWLKYQHRFRPPNSKKECERTEGVLHNRWLCIATYCMRRGGPISRDFSYFPWGAGNEVRRGTHDEHGGGVSGSAPEECLDGRGGERAGAPRFKSGRIRRSAPDERGEGGVSKGAPDKWGLKSQRVRP
jgi:hypothetical protein